MKTIRVLFTSIEVQLFPLFGDAEKPFIKASFTFDFENWSAPWSIRQFAMEMKNQVNALNRPEIQYWQNKELISIHGFGFKYEIGDTLNFGTTVDFVKNDLLIQINRLTVEALILKGSENTITTFFKFSKETETFCKQYLIYFAQFLSDLGIEADTEIKTEINNTLFKVIPKDKNQSLLQIKDALATYIKAPEITGFEIQTTPSDNIAVLQWQANVMHLKSQLQLSQAIIEAKDERIKYLELSRYQFEQIVGRPPQPSADSEELIPGIVTVENMKVLVFQ